MKCEKCFEEWSIQDLGDRMVKFCPFCGAEYKEKEPEGFSSLVDCFKYLKRRFTYTIFFEPKKILSYVSDYMPELMVEKRILKVALEAGVYKQLLDDSGKIIELNIEKTKFTLVNDYGLSEKWAGEAIDWLVKAFGATQSKDTVEVKVATATNVAPLEEKKAKPVTASTTTNSNKTIGRDNKGDYTYVGQTDAKGIPNGPGELTYSSGEKFIGTFKNGRLSGKGKWLTSYGQTFEGMFENGKQVECDGVLTERNGAVYKGHFRRGLRMHGVMLVTNSGHQKPSKVKYDNGHQIGYLNN